MARVYILQPREQAAHFGLYRTSPDGEETIFVRRKVGEPTDYMHTKSRKLKTQRDNLTLASQHYASLTPGQKAITRHQFEEVEYQKSHGKTDIKLLSGRQLFISKEIHSLNTAGKQLEIPYDLCIILADQGFSPLDGNLWVRYLKDGNWKNCKKEELAKGSWLFTEVPTKQEAYQIEGEADGFFDPMLAEHQSMTEQAIRAYRYHHLLIAVPGYGYSFMAAWWQLPHLFTAHVSAGTIHISSTLTTYDFTGDLIVGIKDYPEPEPPFQWIQKHTHAVIAGSPNPRHYYDTFGGLGLQEGKQYYIWHELIDNGTNLWEGGVNYYLID